MNNIVYEIIVLLNSILFPNSWIKFFTIPLIIILISFFVFRFMENKENKYGTVGHIGNILQVSLLSVYIYGMFSITTQVAKDYLKESIDRGQVIEYLQHLSKDSKIYINNKLQNESVKIINNIIEIKHVSAHHSRKKNEFIQININSSKEVLEFKLYQDTKIIEEYWVYFFDRKVKEYIYVGRIHTDIFMNNEELLIFQKNQEKKKTNQIEKNNKLHNWKVMLVIGFMLLLISLLVYDGYFRSTHFKTTKKYFFWILFVSTLGIFFITMLTSLFDGGIMFFLITIIIFLMIKSILTVFFCKECSNLERKYFFSKKKTCSNCEAR